MKHILIIAILFFVNSAFAQSMENCGLDNNPLLTIDESHFLNDYLKDQRGPFDFSEKKIIFVTGNSGNSIGTKHKYFQNIKEWSKRYDRKIATTLIVLNEQEISDSGHHAILTYWVKVMPKNRKKKMMRKTVRLQRRHPSKQWSNETVKQ